MRALLLCFIESSSVFLAETDPHEGKRKVEALWPIYRLHNQKSRYIFDLFYRRRAISRGLNILLHNIAFDAINANDAAGTVQ